MILGSECAKLSNVKVSTGVVENVADLEPEKAYVEIAGSYGDG